MPKDNRENTWLESAVAAAEAAMKEWVCYHFQPAIQDVYNIESFRSVS
jgi:hypothetical protein